MRDARAIEVVVDEGDNAPLPILSAQEEERRIARARWARRLKVGAAVAAVLLVDAFIPYGFVGVAVVAAVQAVVVVRNWRIGIRP